jgi:cytochrome c-type biogenesis protein CcmF
MLSRESFFLFNNLFFLLVLFVCFFGVVAPIFSELLTGQKVTFGPAWYTRIVGPLFAALMLLMGAAPLSAWGTSSLRTLGRQIWKSVAVAVLITVALFFTYTRNGLALFGFFLIAFVLLITFQEFWRSTAARMRAHNESLGGALWALFARDPRRYGGYIVHISMMLMAIGILGISFFQVETQSTLAVNGTIQLSDYSVKYDSIAQFRAADGRQVTRAVVGVYNPQGTYLGELHPRIDYYPDAQQNSTIPGEFATMKDDLYVLLIDWQPATAEGATFKVFVNPLVNWLWIGAFVFVIGIVMAAVPRREGADVRVRRGRVVPADGHQPSAAD